ncbi:TPA: hypothetical protein N0F65_005494 [Lagenidium giganteum]|uniref:BZIP domain-containing protein n=1 Tax=Lagenidium giganteum TaxID=4803 RepID=A0AAV2YKY5_9STRA|nr:TPA: hypothetical protein N0F65_005494 [Lagenidium giganteum]
MTATAAAWTAKERMATALPQVPDHVMAPDSATATPPVRRPRPERPVRGIATTKAEGRGAVNTVEAEMSHPRREDAHDDEEDDHEPDDATSTAQSTVVDNPAPTKQPRKRGRKPLLENEAQRKTRRKTQCMLNQRRYRARQRGMIEVLSLENDQINAMMQELNEYHQFLLAYDRGCTSGATAAGDDPTPLLTAKHFFHLFRDGFALHSSETSELQERFLRFIMDPGLISQGASQRGIDALILQLKRCTSYHAVFKMTAQAYHIVPTGRQIDGLAQQGPAHGEALVVEAVGELLLRLSRDTIVLLFPHIIENEALCYRVVGHEITPRLTVLFCFNPAGKVCKLEIAVDWAEAFTALLGSAADAATILSKALITPYAELGVDPHGEQDAAASSVGENKQLNLKYILL